MEYAQCTRDDLGSIPDGKHMCMLNLTVYADYTLTSRLKLSFKGEVRVIRINYKFDLKFTKDGTQHSFQCFCHRNNTMASDGSCLIVFLEY